MNRRTFLKTLGLTAVAVAFSGLPTPTDGSALAAWKDVDLVVGDVFTVAGYQRINPITFQMMGCLQQFVITAIEPHAIYFRPHTVS